MFPDCPLKAKHHYLMHYPDLILHFGPLIRLWTLRFESKHCYFKQCARRLHNFKNLCSSLAERHQLLQAYLSTGKLFFPNIQVVGLASNFEERLYSHEIQQAVSRTLANRKNTTELSAVVYKNTKYSKGLAVAVAETDHGILFGKIVLILLDQSRIHLILEKHQSVLLVDVGVRYLTLQGGYICVDIDSVTMPETVVDTIIAALPKLDEDRLKALVERLLLVVGVEEVSDLSYVKEDDIKDILTPLQCRKLVDAFQRRESALEPQTIILTPLQSPSQPSTIPPVPYPPQYPPNWITTFHVPWEKMAPTLRQAISTEKRAAHSDRLQMIRVIVDEIRIHCPNPTRAECSPIAKNIVAQYPKTFSDVTDEGELLGCGYTSLLNQIKTRVEHINRGNTLSRIRRLKRTNENEGDTSQSKNTRNQVDSYGCINWQPHNLPEGETLDSLEVKRQMLVTLYRKEGPRGAESMKVDDLMHITYLQQRQFINSNPPPRLDDVMQEWPFLFQKRWLLCHFEKLTGIDILSRLTMAIQNKGRRIINYFQHQKLKWRGEIQSLLTEMENDSRTLQDQDLMATSVVLLLMAFFREAMESLFILADVTATQADIEAQQGIPDTPRLIMLGHSIMTASKWMLSIEGNIILTLDSSDTFITAFAVIFASYYIFNIEYQESAACTLELVQRFLVRINPEDGNGVSKRIKRVVQRKVTAINPHFSSFIRSLMEFEWKTSN
uniref:Uncharacterized protein n=1 Tax=Cyprinus carpio TaxID=7962 RepID=A0A8C2FGN5_CYPCA